MGGTTMTRSKGFDGTSGERMDWDIGYCGSVVN